MDNTYYILSNNQIEIERFHICTWEFPNDFSYIEFGIEFPFESFSSDEVEFYLTIPYIETTNEVTSLLMNLLDSANSQFIFNDVVIGQEWIGRDKRDGNILRFEKRQPLTIVPCEITKNDGLLILKIKKPIKHDGNIYFRLLIKIKEKSIAIKKKGIAKTLYIYDIKVNETRNISQEVYDLKSKKQLNLCIVKNLFCFHAVPDVFDMNFVDSTKMKNMRKLEASAFHRYLPQITRIKNDCYNILFLKDSGKESFSLFTIFIEESIGYKQIALAVGANILCSLLFAVSTLRAKWDSGTNFFQQIPWEYWGSIVILILLTIYLFIPFKKKRK